MIEETNTTELKQVATDFKPTPVTVISGFLGSGKTTLLQHILKNKENIKAAVLVNDMAEINVDSALIKETKLLKAEEELVELQNGCICCTLKDELVKEMKQLALKSNFDVIIIESTGVSDPKEVAQTFFFEEEDIKDGKVLNDLAKLDNMVTVIDATSFFDYIKETSQVNQKFSYEGGEYDDRNLCNLIMEQIEFAQVILINKIDLVSKDVLDHIYAIVKTMNPKAEIFKTIRSEIELKYLIKTQYFKEEDAFNTPNFLDAEKRKNQIPETITYCISSFVYKKNIPFHPNKIDSFMEKYFMFSYLLYQDPAKASEEEDDEWVECDDNDDAEEDKKEDKWEDKEEEIKLKKEKIEKEEETEKKEKALQKRAYEKLHKITYKKRLNAFGNCFRSKGIVWLGNPGKYNGYGTWSHAGNYLDFGFANSWYDLPVENVDDKDFTFEKALQNAKTEIVFIGQDLKVDNIKAELDKCLLTVKEFSILKKEILKKKGYKTYLFDDPYTDWPVWLQCDNPHVAQEKYYAKYLKAEDDLRLKEDTSKENQIKQI